VFSSDDINVMCNGHVVVGDVKSITEGVACLFATHWLYNLQYHKRAAKFYEFLEVYVFKLNSNKLCRAAVSRMYNELIHSQ